MSSKNNSLNRYLFLAIIMYFFNVDIYCQKVKGSDTLLPLMQKIAEEYIKYNPNDYLSITGGGSGVGIEAIIENNAQIAMSSRSLNYDEIETLRKKNIIIKEKIVAYDALAIVVNKKNPINELTKEELEKIFRGKINNWSELGGKNQKIVVYTRETSSGTYSFFQNLILKRKNFTKFALSMPATGAIVESINDTPGGIGYIGVPYIDGLKPLNISFTNGAPYYSPIANNNIENKYPIVRPLYLFYAKKDSLEIKNFINFLSTPAVREIIISEGYLP